MALSPKFIWDGFSGLSIGTIAGQMGWLHTIGIGGTYTPALTAINSTTGNYWTTADNSGTVGDFDGAAKNANAMSGLNRAKPFDFRKTWQLASNYDNGQILGADTPPYFVSAVGGDVSSGINRMIINIQYYDHLVKPNVCSIQIQDQSNGIIFDNLYMTPDVHHTLRIHCNGTTFSFFADDVVLGSSTFGNPTGWDDNSATICLYGKTDSTQGRIYGYSIRSIDNLTLGSATGNLSIKGNNSSTLKASS